MEQQESCLLLVMSLCKILKYFPTFLLIGSEETLEKLQIFL